MIIGDFLSNNEILETLARRMKEYRLAARLSQRELAQNRVWATRLYAISSKGRIPTSRLAISYRFCAA